MTDNRHHAELKAGPREGGQAAIYPVITCESGADVSVSQIAGGLILGHEENPVSSTIGPVFVECAEHGTHLGLVQFLVRASNSETHQSQVSMPILLIPLHNIEYVVPESLR